MEKETFGREIRKIKNRLDRRDDLIEFRLLTFQLIRIPFAKLNWLNIKVLHTSDRVSFSMREVSFSRIKRDTRTMYATIEESNRRDENFADLNFINFIRGLIRCLFSRVKLDSMMAGDWILRQR